MGLGQRKRKKKKEKKKNQVWIALFRYSIVMRSVSPYQIPPNQKLP